MLTTGICKIGKIRTSEKIAKITPSHQFLIPKIVTKKNPRVIHHGAQKINTKNKSPYTIRAKISVIDVP